jgi:hypothetical protein
MTRIFYKLRRSNIIVTAIVEQDSDSPPNSYDDVRSLNIGNNYVELSGKRYAIVRDLETKKVHLYSMGTGGKLDFINA